MPEMQEAVSQSPEQPFITRAIGNLKHRRTRWLLISVRKINFEDDRDPHRQKYDWNKDRSRKPHPPGGDLTIKRQQMRGIFTLGQSANSFDVQDGSPNRQITRCPREDS